ncbi:MAG: hypothetical protein CVV27_12065 [Candidatus Melainabacteria bacterium HGW-Melainabacteria-1]|nr:MAG: hypothetical protein CVV27_12065 [Candidatus Melainabacteria bacterium HGW-Melainabacteria-1]
MKGLASSWCRYGSVLALLSGLLAGCRAAPGPLDLPKLQQEIHRLSNQMRAETGAAALVPLAELDQLSLRHSQNMAEQNFFEHDDPQGNSPAQRLQKYLPALISANSGENIALRSLAGESETDLAKTLIQMWRDSPGHYRNIINPEYWHLGVGLIKHEDKIYATQTFAAGLALLESELPGRVASGQPVTLRFRFVAAFAKSELNAFLHAPDPNARIPAGNGSHFIGKGPLTPNWTDDQHFELRIATDYGLGTYRLALGRKGAYYDSPLSFEVVSPTI